MHAGDTFHQRIETFDVLNIHCGNYVDVRVQQLNDIFVALRMFGAFNIRVGQLVHQHHCGFARKDGVNIHFGEGGTFVLDRLTGNGIQLGS